jgi:hypothetical protein
MADVHLPNLEADDDGDAEASTPNAPAPAKSRHRGIGRLLLEVLLISTGVFLGLAGEQWRESAHHHELAHEALRRFRAEIATNRKAVAGVKDYHVDMRKRIKTYLAADANARKSLDVVMRGVQPVRFEHTAMDLAIATQSLTYIDRGLAFDLSRIYSAQDDYAVLSRGVLQAMYLRPPSENLDGFFRTVALYYDDVVLSEPKLIEMYDALQPRIDGALGE